MEERLSTHFPLSEMVRSEMALRHGIDNTPPREVVCELRRLCLVVLEPAREWVGVPLFVSSGYRCADVNKLVKGAQGSAHVFGRAADIIPVGLNLHDAFRALRRSTVPYDQLIVECSAWLHIAVPVCGKAARRQALVGERKEGKWVYTFAEDDL